MKQKTQRREFSSLIFGLTDKNVEFRNRWRIIAGLAIWLTLSGLAMLLTMNGALDKQGKTIIIVMSFIKFIPFLWVIYGLARIKAGRYLDDVYELQDEDLAADFLEEVAFGYGHEKITIKEGRISADDEKSHLILIGGPGSVQVNLDSVALVEKVNGEPKVIHPRNDAWKLGRFERIREIGKFDEVGKREYAIINLRDQLVNGLFIKSRTKDGIPIEAQGIKVMFSLLRKQGSENEKVQGSEYSFDDASVQSLVYSQTIITRPPPMPQGVTFPWDATVIPLVISELENIITTHTLSEILASISQKEVDNSSSNEETIAQMRVEMTGQQSTANGKTETRAPNFKSRSKITAQFFEKPFKDKASKLGVSVEWIDIGTWQHPSDLILEKHKDAWNLARENAKKRAEVERSGKIYEMKEVINLINDVVISNYEKGETESRVMNKDVETFIAMNPDLSRQIIRQDGKKKDATSIALEILKSFRKELRAARDHIKNEESSSEEKQIEIAKIDKALFDISHLTDHWINKTP
jgi:hypothetical protein